MDASVNERVASDAVVSGVFVAAEIHSILGIRLALGRMAMARRYARPAVDFSFAALDRGQFVHKTWA